MTRVAANDSSRVRGGAAVRLEQDDVEPRPFRVPVGVVAFDVLDPALAGGDVVPTVNSCTRSVCTPVA